ncbi:MAG TPA: lipid IV(A) 3-deoxy-D-manno-octulosonic acid transferase [Burkholderiales bacterium]|nr:lipid IV(A) 3-deoxy-D-manno-octulosonic acid transferase [Burkholderiales bacterium]
MLTRALYTLALYLLLPWALLHLLLRARRQPAYLHHVGERFGFFPDRVSPSVIWIHAVSVGETRAAEPLVKSLQTHYPQHRILLTHGTPTGRQTSLELYGERVDRCYLPYDFTWASRRFLQHFRPIAGIFMETEIWPNLVHASAESAIPLYLVNARMSAKSARGYRRMGALTGNTLSRLSHIGAQTEQDAQRLRELGARNVTITGNIKFDRIAPTEMVNLGVRLRNAFGAQRPVFLAASTREGEEALILDTLSKIDMPRLLTVVVPRHPQRFEDVGKLITQRGIKVQRRSENAPIAGDTLVVIGDSMGEMFAYYAACDVAFVGGSLLPLGGQNLLEACAVGCPIIVGPHTFNFEEATRGAIEAGAAIRVTDAQDLAKAIERLLHDANLREAMSTAGKNFTNAHRGATAKTLELLEW